MKKLLSILLVMMLTLGITTTAFATEAGQTTQTSQNASFTKTYDRTNDGTTSPAETFTFTFEADSVSEMNTNLTKDDMPAIDSVSVAFAVGEAGGTDMTKNVPVDLAGISWPDVGVYIYKVTETAGSTAGVTYDANELTMKVTVAYDEVQNKFYTAFVTTSLADEDENGITDVKAGGFTNEYSAGALEISKTVTGNMGDRTKYFAVTVTLTGEAGKTYQNPYAVTGGSKIENGEASCAESTITIGTEKTFYVKHGETITIANLPYGVTYTVAEADYTTGENPYDEAIYTFSDESGKKIDSEKDTVGIINNRGITVDTGIGLDSAPYIVILLAVVAGLGFFFMRKRSAYER